MKGTPDNLSVRDAAGLTVGRTARRIVRRAASCCAGSVQQRAGASIVVAVLMVAVFGTVPAQAQVQVDYDGSELVVRNAGFADQRAVRSFGKSGGGWTIEDEAGNR